VFKAGVSAQLAELCVIANPGFLQCAEILNELEIVCVIMNPEVGMVSGLLRSLSF
jgi:hypothetical protein